MQAPIEPDTCRFRPGRAGLPGAAGRRIALLLRAQAIRMGRTGAAAELPPGLESPDPMRRAQGLLAEALVGGGRPHVGLHPELLEQLPGLHHFGQDGPAA